MSFLRIDRPILCMKKIVLVVCFFALAASLILPVAAHSGQTDSGGGHYDGTDYHYHHGYPAHDHRDMDGDGDIDCPYDFDDQTGLNSGNSSSGNSYYPSWNDDNVIIKTEVVTETVTKEVPHIPSWVYWVFAAEFVIAVALFVAIGIQKNDLKTMAIRHELKVNDIRQSCAKKLAEKKATDEELLKLHHRIEQAKKELEELRGKRVYEEIELEKIKQLRSRMKNAPLDIYFANNGMPVYWKPDARKPYGDFTVYVNAQGNIYHVDRLCAGYRAAESHIFHVIGCTRPCQKCATGFFDFTAVPEWFLPEDTQHN